MERKELAISRIHFINANLLDGVNPAQQDATVTIEGNRIVGINGPVSQDGGDTIVDCQGRTLMPGMTTGHYHAGFHNIGMERGLPAIEKPPVYASYRALWNAQLALKSGFTTVVSAGAPYDIDASLEAAINDGLLVGPRICPCSRDFQTAADEFAWVPWWLHSKFGELATRSANGPEDFRKQVREEINRGNRMIKIYVTGGHGIQVPKSIDIVSRDELEMAVRTAHERGARVRVHISRKDRIMEAIECGVDILDHADEIDEECIAAMAKKGTILLPSLLYPALMIEAEREELGAGGGLFSAEDRADFDHVCAMLPKAVAAGVVIATGDDFGSPVMPHGMYGRELAVYVEHAGIEPLEVIRWATRNGGLLYGRHDHGVIAPGNLADMIVVDGDPLADIRVLSKPEHILSVYKDGVRVTGAATV